MVGGGCQSRLLNEDVRWELEKDWIGQTYNGMHHLMSAELMFD